MKNAPTIKDNQGVNARSGGPDYTGILIDVLLILWCEFALYTVINALMGGHHG